MSASGRGKRTAAKKSTGTPKAAAKKAPAKKAATAAAAKAPEAKSGESPWASTFAPRTPGERRYWLVKSEPTTFSFDHLMSAKNRTTQWDGVRNFVARNFMRDGMQVGDEVFFYHSSTNPQAIVGICRVSRAAYPDSTAFDKSHHSYDEKSDPSDPTWFMVDLEGVAPLARPVTLVEIKARPELAGMALLRIGRLSVTPVTAAEWATINAMAR